MGININKQKTVRMSKELTDALPEFISLVDAGANQQGFKVVKNANGEFFFSMDDVAEAMKNDSVVANKVTNASVSKNNNLEILQILFDKNNYSSMKTVEGYLSSKGFDMNSLSIAEEESKFVAKASDIENVANYKISDIEIENGINIMIGKKENIVSDKSSDTPVSKYQLIKKFDWMDAMMTDGTLREKISAGASDGIPFGFGEVTENFMGVLVDAIKEDNVEKIGQAFNDYVSIIGTLKGFMTQLLDTSKKTLDNNKIPLLSVLTSCKFISNDMSDDKNLNTTVDKTVKSDTANNSDSANQNVSNTENTNTEVVTPVTTPEQDSAAADSSNGDKTPEGEANAQNTSEGSTQESSSNEGQPEGDKTPSIDEIVKSAVNAAVESVKSEFEKIMTEQTSKNTETVNQLNEKIGTLQESLKKTSEDVASFKSVNRPRNGTSEASKAVASKSRVLSEESWIDDSYARYQETLKKSNF